jgi:tetratricopeptide (TPR) repeat protein
MRYSRNFWKSRESFSLCLRRTRNPDEFIACLKAFINREQGNILMTIGSWDDAEAVFQGNVRRAQKIGHAEMVAENKADLATILYRKGKSKKALRLLEDAYRVFRGNKNHKAQNFTLLHRGIIYEHTGNYPKAMKCYDQQLSTAKKIGYKHDIAIAIGNKGVVYYHLGEYEKSIACYMQQLALSEEMDDTLNMAVVQGNLGIAYQHLGNLKKAIRHYKRSLKLSEQLGYKLGISVALANLGTIYSRLGAYNKALNCHRRNLSISREMGNKQGESYALGNIGVLCMNQGEFAKACDCFNETLSISQSLSDKKSISLALGNLGKAYAAQKRHKKAETSFQRAIELLRETGVKYHLCHFLLHSAYTHYAMKVYEQATAENEEADSIAQEVKREDVVFACTILRARLQALTDRKGALRELDSLLNKTKKEEERAPLHYWLFKISKHKTHRANALALYRKLAKQTPHELYARRLKELS